MRPYDEPCTGREKPSGHCWCQRASIQHAMMYHVDVKCCWCGEETCKKLHAVSVPAHGPHAVQWV